MEMFSPALPPDIDDVPSAVGAELPPGPVPGRPYALPADVLAEQYGPLFYADFTGSRRLYACSLALVDELCDESRFTKGITDRLDRFRTLVENGLFTSYPGENGWQQAHDVLIPGFSFSGLRSYHPAMLDINRQLLAQWDAAAGRRAVDVAGDLAKLAMDTVGLAGFGARFDSYHHDGLADIPASFAAALAQILAPGGGDRTVFAAERDKLYAFIDDLIAGHRAGAVDLDDLLALMLEPDADGRPRLDHDAVRNQILTFLIAGQDTTSTLMPTAMYSIVKHPAVLHQACREVDALFGPDDDHVPAFDEIGKLTYIRQIVDETLRLSPPVREIDRMALADTVIGGRYPIPKGTVVTITTSALHRQPEWGDNVDTFDPDRFGAEQAAGRPVNLFKPFGTGARSCIGRQFALHEATMALATLLHRYRFLDVDHYQLRTHSDLLRKPVGFRLELARRTPADRRHAGPAAPSAPAERPRAVAAPGSKVTVLHGSNLGNCRALAQQLADEATDLGYRTTVAALDTAAGALPGEGALVVVAASYNGQPTDDARRFVEWLDDAGTPAQPAIPYAVLGVGDRNWAETYQSVPKRIDERLAELIGPPVIPRGEADTSGDFAGTVEDFSAALWQALAPASDTAALDAADNSELLYELRAIDGPVTSAIDARFEVQPATVLDNVALVDVDDGDMGNGKRLIRIALPDGVEYHTGDHVTVLPDNSPEVVQEVAELLELRLDRRISVNPRRSTRRAIAIDREVSVRELLTHFIELRKAASRSQLLKLAMANPCPPERAALAELAENPEDRALSVTECLAEFPATELSRAELLELFEPMGTRHYSIASSARRSAREVELVVSVLEGPARSGYGVFRGVSSSYLADAAPGQQIRMRVDSARKAFRAGAEPAKNVIMVGAGTGVAPFRGFIGDRLAAQAAGEPFTSALCFFGVRHPDVDYLFRDEFEAAEQAGVVRMRPAFSRRPEDEIRYVQDRIAADAEEVWAMLGDPGADAHIYVCGDGARMAPAVRGAFRDIYRRFTGADEETAAHWLADLVNTDRYVEDVWAQ
ncbi:bifunctional cytochrome P450/NADPH--P450 reductase [Mycolicibacterium brisbanense]|uniref:Bifunctional cytochrome P450/NADPH--P450 reductase n=1 Tax=Mycolicibacterium brisbanense TaxID=146020 RepID=A0A100W2R7_9MYCO|nr:cytochrome P450 [Mycolicibacterium brisbanense]MCV7158403.1 cytochrome P450 [Mycolicibacterium brisbanense]GAS90547.1 sulfite reductase subunit alpha, flavoprotein [Mycolicibacterium brisbanense]